jgi:hypothetical protein
MISLSSAKQEMRLRVERLLKGSGRADDISTLYLHLRHRSRGRATVAEIGDSVAHREEKNKGIVTGDLRDFFTVMKTLGPTMIPDSAYNYSAENLPSNFREFLPAALRLAENDKIKLHTGLNRAAAERMLPGIVAKIRQHSDGRLQIHGLTPTEIGLCECLSGYIRARAAFKEDRLITEFVDALVDENLINSSERKILVKARNHIALVAACSLHMTRIDLGDGTFAEITLSPTSGPDHKRIGVYARAFIPGPINVYVSRVVFDTSLVAAEWTDGLQIEEANWEFPLEIRPDWRLGTF